MYHLLHGDCRAMLKTLPDCSVDSVVTDPPYELGFMGKGWDKSGIANSVELWTEVLRVLKPGGHLLAFSGSRTYHRMVCAIEDAGFEVRDQIMWVYGSGFPKSLDVSKAIDKAAGAEREKVRVKPRAETSGTMAGSSDTRPWIEKSREIGYHEVAGKEPVTAAAAEWQGWGTALKPAHEPIVVARKPLVGTVASNVLAHGAGALNVDGCRIKGRERTDYGLANSQRSQGSTYGEPSASADFDSSKGRWPANLIHDGSDEVVALFPDSNGSGGSVPNVKISGYGDGVVGTGASEYFGGPRTKVDAGSGSAARFFYCAKASKRDRNDGCEHLALRAAGGMQGRQDGSMGSITYNNNHPTVKPTDLMRYLCRLITPPGGLVLDPFTGSGSTGKAAMLEGFRFVGCELSEEYLAIAKARIEAALGADLC